MTSHMLPEGLPAANGLYDPRNEHDACGVGLIANINNLKSHRIVSDGLSILKNLEHRGAVGAGRRRRRTRGFRDPGLVHRYPDIQRRL